MKRLRVFGVDRAVDLFDRYFLPAGFRFSLDKRLSKKMCYLQKY